MPAEHKLAVRDGDRVREVLLVGPVTVGRSPACEISSPDPRLSRTHATFDVVGGEVLVRDLGSRNGTTVNGQPITEHRLLVGEQVEVGPFIVQLVEPAVRVVDRRPRAGPQAEDATVMLPQQHGRAQAAPPVAAAPAASSPADSDIKTRMMPRSELAGEVAPPAPEVTGPRETLTRPEQPAQPKAEAPKTPPPVSAASPPPVAASPAPQPSARAAATELTFANAALLWIAPVVLISFLAGLVPDLMQPDARAPVLRAYYLAMASSAVDLVTMSREPAVPIDNVTAALRRQAGVISARIVGMDGRVLAPLDQAGTTVPAPAAAADAAPAIADGADGAVEVRVPARTGDGRAVVVAMTIDPERVHPSPPGSIIGTLLLILSLGAAWLVARRLTAVTNSRLSQLGEEIELMTTRQISVGRDPFSLKGATRILDAVTFALSAAGRVAGGAELTGAPARDLPKGEGPATASIDADAGFHILKVDRGCESLLGMNLRDAPGAHLIDAFPDQAVSNEVMRLLTMATQSGMVSGDVISGTGVRLGIDVTKGAGDTSLSIRFRRL